MKIIKFFVREFRWLVRNGVTNYILKIVQRKRFEVEVLPGLEHHGTSITDGTFSMTWPTLASKASTDVDLFSKFRRSQVLIDALDHVTIEDGRKYLVEILKMSSFKPEFKNCLKSTDSVGKPIKYRFKPYGIYSPTVIRYLKVYLDLNLLFTSLDDLKIVEIGIGFGGQAKVISELSNPKSYTFFDLPPVLELSKRFLGKNLSLNTFEFLDGRNPVPVDSDLIISNYAFSELSIELQKIYLNEVILNAKRGYITWNNLSEKQLGGFSVAELLRKIPNSQILPESPLTYPGNCIIYWKNI